MRLSLGTLGREYIDQIEMIQDRIYYNLRMNRQADERQCDTSMTNIFARPIKTPDSGHLAWPPYKNCNQLYSLKE